MENLCPAVKQGEFTIESSSAGAVKCSQIKNYQFYETWSMVLLLFFLLAFVKTDPSRQSRPCLYFCMGLLKVEQCCQACTGERLQLYQQWQWDSLLWLQT